MYEIKFYQPDRPLNATIINLEDYNIEEIEAIVKVQKFQGRTEIEYPGTNGRIPGRGES